MCRRQFGHHSPLKATRRRETDAHGPRSCASALVILSQRPRDTVTLLPWLFHGAWDVRNPINIGGTPRHRLLLLLSCLCKGIALLRKRPGEHRSVAAKFSACTLAPPCRIDRHGLRAPFPHASSAQWGDVTWKPLGPVMRSHAALLLLTMSRPPLDTWPKSAPESTHEVAAWSPERRPLQA